MEHPAIDAWSRLSPERIEPVAIERLKLKGKSAVYRLLGVGPDESAVIAKRCPIRTGRIECVIYQECLAWLPVVFPRFYGLLEDASFGDSCWLFVEDAGRQEYSREDAAHRLAAGRWLGLIHACGMEPLNVRLPDRGANHYLNLLLDARATFVKQLANPVLSAEELSTLRTVAMQLDEIELHWSAVEEFCGTVPNTLVHGDLVAKNVRLKGTPAAFEFLVFDWENAGWGIPATDLCQFIGRSTVSPDLGAYQESVGACGRRVERSQLRRLAEYGNIFRVLDNLAWAASIMTGDAYRFLVKPIAHMRIYEQQMADALRPTGWS
jgi:hypothetical protein